jgi:pimeloyl-ACP methyl ester carboxylesterase
MKYTEQIFATPFTDFHTLVWGHSGPKILLLHGFPETPHVFESVAEGLVSKGYHVFAPFLPGYGPTPPIYTHTSITHLDDLARCLSALSDALVENSGKQEKIILLGHDWGAVSAYVTAAHHPERFSNLITMAVPPIPVFLKDLLRHPSQLIRSGYMLFFQLRAGIPEKRINADRHRYLKQLCLKWSGGAEPSQAYFAECTTPFDTIGSFTLPLGYYRGLFPVLSGSWSKWLKSIKLAYTKIDVPTLILVGKLDGCIPAPMYRGYQQCFTKTASFSVIEGAGHFVPIDSPEAIIDAITNTRQSN